MSNPDFWMPKLLWHIYRKRMLELWFSLCAVLIALLNIACGVVALPFILVGMLTGWYRIKWMLPPFFKLPKIRFPH